MIRIKDGTELATLPVVGLELVRHLEYYDGPLLSHFRHRRQGDHYLYYWCDCNDSVNRWMLLRVNETNIIRLVSRFVPLDFVIPKACQDDFVYFVDIGGEGNFTKVTLARLDAIPNQYIPEHGAYLPTEASKDVKHPRSYSVLIESFLSIKELGDLPSIFSQAYALLYNLLVLKTPKLHDYPWRGGFSAMHFYRWLLDRIPGEDRPSVASLQYSSPGFIRFSLAPEIAARVGDLIANVLEDDDAIREALRDLYAYIRENNLNDLNPDEESDWVQHDDELTRLTRAIIERLEIPDADELISAAARPFEAAKIVLSFARRIRQLAQLDVDGQVRFPASARRPHRPNS